MDKTILRKFAIESKIDLGKKIENKLNSFYVDETFSNEQKGDVYILRNDKHSLSLTNDDYKKREKLISRIKSLGSKNQVIEEATYTWFNRLIALRYMELNDILPLTKDNQSLGIRVLSSKDNTLDPEILKFSNLINPDLDIEFNKEWYSKLSDNIEKYKYILLLICKKLGKVIPQVFDGFTEYIDILMPDNFLSETGFIYKLITEVPTNNFNSVEVIGWLYQYYNQIEKDRVISAKKAYKKNEIPYATQLFTPDWIVKYMVENSLGRYWVEHNDDNNISDNWEYFIKDNIENKNDKLNPTAITFIDPCCGSGHILVYAFEVFYQIYRQAGYNKNDIPELILKNNLYGLDIDDRAGQLSILSILLKAREYDKNIFNKDVIHYLNIMSIQESIEVQDFAVETLPKNIKEKVEYLKEAFSNAKEIGSLLVVNNIDYSDIIEYLKHSILTLEINNLNSTLPTLIKEAMILSRKYDVIVTNPPYMGAGNMSDNLKEFLKENYPISKTDLCTAFMEINILKDGGFLSMINQQQWMFIGSFVKLRKRMIEEFSMLNMLHLGMGTFGADFGTTTFVFKKQKKDEESIYIDLRNFSSSNLKEQNFLNIKKKKNNYYKINNNVFFSIPDNPFAYWISDKSIEVFRNSIQLSNLSSPRQGLITGDVNRFVRKWYECSTNDLNLFTPNSKWVPYSNGGKFRRWYGNNEDVVNWLNNGMEIINFVDNNGNQKSRPQNKQYYFKPGLTWTAISSGTFCVRYFPEGFIFSNAGMAVFCDYEKLLYFNGMLNSKIVKYYLSVFSESINFNQSDIAKLPVIETNCQDIDKLAQENVNICKDDWDSFETSWDFTKHPLLKPMSKCRTIRDSLANWSSYSKDQFDLLKHNEEELNKIFIDIYGLQDELTPEVEGKDVTIRKVDKLRDIKSLISYAVGCMFGRYSLDKEGLIYAGGEFDYNKYKIYEVDKDNIIPITDDAYFNDDIVSKFKRFLKDTFGEDALSENMDYIAEVLGKKNLETSEDTIRRYFNEEFFNDHCKIYQKRPIYWLFDSGKNNGFKCLIYMHRYNDNLVAKMRLDYLHRMQTTYEKLISDVNYKLTTDLSLADKKEAQKRLSDLTNKYNETIAYDERIAHLANQRINIDLDDGVIVNYAKFQDVLSKIK